jgi:hypothetical protein
MRAVYRLLGVLLVAAAAGCVPRDDEPDPTPPGRTDRSDSGDAGPPVPNLRIDLRAGKTVVKPGESPEWRAFLVNDGSAPVTVVLPGDGSNCGWRTPVVRWRSGDDPADPLLVGGRCGNINSLRPEEVIDLAPGQRVELTEWMHWPTPGGVRTHRIWVELENIPDLRWQGVTFRDHDPVAMQRIRQSPSFKAVSNVVAVEVRE